MIRDPRPGETGKTGARRGRRAQREGFVLMEGLAALALGALVLTTVPIVTGLLLRNWQRTTLNTDTLETVAAGMTVLRRDLTTMRREQWGGGQSASYAFFGTPDTMGIAVAGDGTGPGPGRSLVMFEAKSDETGGTLLRTASDLSPGTRTFDPTLFRNPVVLLNGPWRFQFSYASEVEGRLNWVPGWTRTDSLPDAIQLEVLDPGSGARIVPPLVVRPAIHTEPGCIDPRAGPCGA